MKAKIFCTKLILNKKTIADLDMDKMKNVHGGDEPPTGVTTGLHWGTSFCCTGPTGDPMCPACPIC